MSSIRDRVVDALISDVAVLVSEFWDSDYSAKCASEIERAFAAAIILSLTIRGQRISYSREASLRDEISFFLEPQFVVGDYRVDFLLGDRWSGKNLLNCVAIECDGHDFHDRTKEQAARDKSRDRFLSANVGRVLRFTGSEIYRDPSGCAGEAAKILSIINQDRRE